MCVGGRLCKRVLGFGVCVDQHGTTRKHLESESAAVDLTGDWASIAGKLAATCLSLSLTNQEASADVSLATGDVSMAGAEHVDTGIVVVQQIVLDRKREGERERASKPLT